jgi:hypothetical protein
MTTEQAKSMVSQPVIGTFVREVEAAEAGDSHLLPVDIKIDEAQSEDGDGFAVYVAACCRECGRCFGVWVGLG